MALLALKAFYLSEYEMDGLYSDLGNFNDFLFWTGLITDLASTVPIVSPNGVALIAMGLGASAAFGSTIIAAAPLIAFAGIVIGTGMIIAGQEMSGIQESIYDSGAGETGGTMTITTYGVINQYTVTTDQGEFSSFGITMPLGVT